MGKGGTDFTEGPRVASVAIGAGEAGHGVGAVAAVQAGSRSALVNLCQIRSVSKIFEWTNRLICHSTNRFRSEGLCTQVHRSSCSRRCHPHTLRHSSKEWKSTRRNLIKAQCVQNYWYNSTLRTCGACHIGESGRARAGVGTDGLHTCSSIDAGPTRALINFYSAIQRFLLRKRGCGIAADPWCRESR